jgi:hypothetical protein
MYNRAKFLQNGSCGYVLKPQFLSDPTYSLTTFAERLPTSKVALHFWAP